MVHLTVSGHPGSGTTTLVANICARRSWVSLNGGEVFRAAAAERGVLVEEFSLLCEAEPEIDKMLDRRLLDAMLTENGPEVIESRLSGWWAFQNDIDCVSIWLSVSEEERARRVVNREGGSEEDALERIRIRMSADQSRYDALYQLTLSDMAPYDLVIDGDDLRPEEVADAVDSALDTKEMIG